MSSPGCIEDPRSKMKGGSVTRSAFGLVAIDNLLPRSWKTIRSVKLFQKRLQDKLKEAMEEGCEDWHNMYSPRVPLERHTVRDLR